MTDRELMQQALSALNQASPSGWSMDSTKRHYGTIEALRARLAQPEEPDWSAAGFSKPPKQQDKQCPSCGGFCKPSGCERENVPPKREFIGLTNEEIEQIAISASSKLSAIYLAEAQLKGKNYDKS